MAAQLGVGTAPEGWVPVERRWLGLDRRSIVPAVVVVALVVLMSIVLPAINAATPYNDKVVSGDVMQVQYGVQFTPTPGWGITSGVRVGDAPAGGGYPASASVTTGSVVLTVKVDKYTGTAGKLLNKIRSTSDRLKTDSGLHVNGPSHTGTTSSGLTGAIARYTGTKSEGIIAAFVSAGVGIEVTAVGGPADFTDQMIRDIAGMIDSIQVVPGGAQ